MQNLVEKVVETVKKRNMVPDLPEKDYLPVPWINKVELYLTFYGNDRCEHCVTCSGPHRKETLSPENAKNIIQNIAQYSILKKLRDSFGEGEYHFDRLGKCRILEAKRKPPKKLTNSLKTDYADCLMGKGYTSKWVGKYSTIDLNFGRPSIRLSGGEFSMWPHSLNGKVLSQEERLCYQQELLEYIRKTLPEYDIWILTNARFAASRKKAENFITHWAGESGNSITGGAKTRICISVDVFHRPPPQSTVEEMLKRIWSAARKYGLGAPFLYGVTSSKIGLVGRALQNFKCGKIKNDEICNVSRSSFNETESIIADPIDLIATGGCDELKGFFIKTGQGIILVNNIVILPSGHLAYCCVCVGNYGNFLNDPKGSLKKMVSDPVSVMLRRAETARKLLDIAVELDSSIKVMGTGGYTNATGSTCYQMLSGKRVFGN